MVPHDILTSCYSSFNNSSLSGALEIDNAHTLFRIFACVVYTSWYALSNIFKWPTLLYCISLLKYFLRKLFLIILPYLNLPRWVIFLHGIFHYLVLFIYLFVYMFILCLPQHIINSILFATYKNEYIFKQQN
jgi:hypothetical protein